jgi:sugar O-acyltransferase (sialic acid O-acetyltransferase NeuD family)
VRPLVLVAASGLAREAAAVVELLPQYDVIGCVDDNETLWGTPVGAFEVTGGIDTAASADADLLLCTGKGQSRRALVERLATLGVGHDRYATVVHPSVEVPKSCEIGAGTIVLAQVALTADVTIGRHVVLMPQVTLTHDNVLEDYATLTAGVSLAGGVRIGEAAYIGMNATVRENLTVGPEGVLGMGSALTRDLPTGATWAGSPARPLPHPTQKAAQR